MKKLSLGEDVCARNKFGSSFVDLLLSLCSNLHTFSFDYTCLQGRRRQLGRESGTHVFASHNKLKRLSLFGYAYTECSMR